VADAAFHFAMGLVLGTLGLLPGLVRKFRCNTDRATDYARWLVIAYALGAFTLLPGLLRRMGWPPAFCEGWWMNLFLFHPLINRLRPGGMLIGEMLILGCFAFQYGFLLAALRRRLRA
jgi:hypothetical protein